MRDGETVEDARNGLVVVVGGGAADAEDVPSSIAVCVEGSGRGQRCAGMEGMDSENVEPHVI